MKDAIGAIEPYEIEVQPRDFMYPSEVRKDAEVVGALENGIRSMLGYEPKFSFSTAANDTGLFNFRGIQAINYGSRDIRFQHTDHDLVASITSSTRRRFLRSWRFTDRRTPFKRSKRSKFKV